MPACCAKVCPLTLQAHTSCQLAGGSTFAIPANNASCNNGELRLVGGTGPHEGNVEVCFNGNWGSVCQDRWDSVDASVVCGILGYGREGAQRVLVLLPVNLTPPVSPPQTHWQRSVLTLVS